MSDKVSVWQRYGFYAPWESYLTKGSRHPRRPWWQFVGMAPATPEEMEDPEWMHHLEEQWVRVDGHAVLWDGSSKGDVDEALESYDREKPMDAPLPAIGQVWRIPQPPTPHPVWPGATGSEVFAEVAVTQVREEVGVGLCCKLGDWWFTPLDLPEYDPMGPEQPGHGYRPWPPEGGILVAGPGVPWAPADWKPEE